MALALSAIVFPTPPALIEAWVLLGLALPFLAGVWGAACLYEGFVGFADTIAVSCRQSRECFLRRLILAWCGCYTLVTPLMIYTLWNHFSGGSRSGVKVAATVRRGATMRIQETIAFYLLFGAGVAAAMLLSSERRPFAERFFTTISAVIFWPLYLPLLLSRPATAAKLLADQNEPLDEMAAAIARVNTELDAALSSLDGWAEDVLVSERGRMTELRTALIAHAARIRSMDALWLDHPCPQRIELSLPTERRPYRGSGRRAGRSSPAKRSGPIAECGPSGGRPPAIAR